MTVQISVDTLPAITHNQIPVITTELLAQLYGTEAIRIQQNHKRNSDRFVEGKHFFKIAGEELKNLRLSLRESQISPKTRSLILWTERGAARHAKMLETDQAWDVFEKLEDCYFSQQPTQQNDIIQGDERTMVVRFDRNGKIIFTEQVSPDALVCTPEIYRHYLEKNGWIVVHKDQLIDKLLSM